MADDALADYLLEVLEPVGRATMRRMFGGVSIYLEGVIVAIVYDDTAYLKADDRNRPDFEAAGSKPFLYLSRGRSIAMSYWEIPAAILEEPDELRDWTLKARAASLRSRDANPPPRHGKGPRPPRQPGRKAGSRRARRGAR